MGGRCYPEVGNLLDHYTVEFTFPDGTKLFSFSRHMNGCWETYADYAHGTKGSAVLMTNLSTPNTRIYKSQNQTPENLIWRYGQTEKNPYIGSGNCCSTRSARTSRTTRPGGPPRPTSRRSWGGRPSTPGSSSRSTRSRSRIPVCQGHRPHDLRRLPADPRQRRRDVFGAPARDHQGDLSTKGKSASSEAPIGVCSIPAGRAVARQGSKICRRDDQPQPSARGQQA